MAKIPIDKFNSGITDLIFNGDISSAEVMDNFNITKEGKMVGRNGCKLYADDGEQLPNESRVGSLKILDDTLLAQSLNKIYHYDEINDWTLLQGPSSGDLFQSMTSTTYASFAVWNNHLLAVNDQFDLPQKIYKDSSGDLQIRTAGMPALASDPVITPDSDDSKSYIYKFLYRYDYTVGDLSFSDYGSTTQVSAASASDFSAVGHYNQISSIPSISGNNYDTANIKLEIYRTINNGTTFYYVNEINNGTTTFEDTVTDTILQTRALIYTEGGVYDNDSPPASKYIVVANDVAWYLNVRENSLDYNYRVRQSIKGDVDSCPESFFADLEDEITGGGSVGIKPVVMTKSKIYRLDNYIDLTGRGDIDPVVIHDTAGCINHNSVVQTSRGLYWAGNDGFYYTNGYTVEKLSNHLNSTYQTFVNNDLRKGKIYGTNDHKNEVVYWSVSTSTENNKIFLLFEDWISRSENGDIQGAFTTWSGGDYFTPTALLFENNVLIRGDSRGYIFKHRDNDYSDTVLTVDSLPSDYDTQAVIYQWKHMAFDFGDPHNNKWVSKVNIGFQNESNVHMDLQSFDNGRLSSGQLKEIVRVDGMTWGSQSFIWNSAQHIWNETRLFSKNRWIPKGHLRTRYKQLYITNSLSLLDWSDQKSTADLTGATGLFTLTNSDIEWPDECEGYEIRYSTDGGASYSAWNEITNRISNSVIDTGLSGLSDESGVKWEIRGYNKVERPHINHIIYDYAHLTDKTEGSYYQGSEAGGNS